MRGICSADETSSVQWLAWPKSSFGSVSWKKPVPISVETIWEAIARTGAPDRCASKTPWMRWVLPGPQLPAQTASLPVIWASAAAANAAASSLCTWTHSIASLRRMASESAFRLSPTSP